MTVKELKDFLENIPNDQIEIKVYETTTGDELYFDNLCYQDWSQSVEFNLNKYVKL